MIRATMRHVQVLNGVIARSANSVPQLKKPVTSLLAPSVGGTLLQSKMFGWFPGSFSQPALPTAYVTDLTKDVKEDVEIAAKRRFPEYKPVLFSRQINLFPMKGVWEETEYHVKVQTGETDYIQVRVATTFPDHARVWFNGFVDHRTREDPIRPYYASIGGYSDVQLPPPDIIHKAGELKGAVEKALDVRFSEFKAVLYRYQVVAGMNYIVKVQTSSDDYVHMMMFQGLPTPIEPPVELICYEYPKTKEDPLVVINC